MPDPRKCCILGICCEPGGGAQRADLRAWLLAKLGSIGRAEAGSVDMSGEANGKPTIDQWLDELFSEAMGIELAQELGDDG